MGDDEVMKEFAVVAELLLSGEHPSTVNPRAKVCIVPAPAADWRRPPADASLLPPFLYRPSLPKPGSASSSISKNLRYH